MARPAKKPEDRRDERLQQIRVTSSEKATIQRHAKKAKLSVGAYLRELGLAAGRVIFREPLANSDLITVLKDIANQMRPISNNMNQIARGVNIHGEVDVRQLDEELRAQIETRRRIDAALEALGA